MSLIFLGSLTDDGATDPLKFSGVQNVNAPVAFFVVGSFSVSSSPVIRLEFSINESNFQPFRDVSGAIVTYSGTGVYYLPSIPHGVTLRMAISGFLGNPPAGTIDGYLG